MAKITLYGMSKYFQTAGDDLFKNLVLPTGIDKDTFVENVILRGAEFEVVYSNADFFQEAIGTWSRKWERTMEKWVAALSVDYNPLENYDRMEEWTDNGTSHATSNGSSSTESKISAFNSSEYQPDSSGTVGTNDTTDSNNTNVRMGRAHGNIGVTTSQQMLQSELDIATWNLYEHLADIFLQEFVIPIY